MLLICRLLQCADFTLVLNREDREGGRRDTARTRRKTCTRVVFALAVYRCRSSWISWF